MSAELNPENFKGNVNHPGKFEGEYKAAVYYYLRLLDGDKDGEFTPKIPEDFNPELDTIGEIPTFQYFQVTESESKAFKSGAGLETGDFVVILEDDAGFVSMLAWATKEAMEYYLNEHMSY